MQSLEGTKLAMNKSYTDIHLQVKELLVKLSVSIHSLNLMAAFNSHSQTNQQRFNDLHSINVYERLISANDKGFQNLYMSENERKKVKRF